MKKTLTLIAILLLPTLIYIYFALGVPKAVRAPFFGPRTVISATDKEGNPVTDTIYYSVPEFTGKTSGGINFSSASLKGRPYAAIFVDPDTMSSLLTLLVEDIKLNPRTYHYARFVFFYRTTDKAAISAPDFEKSLNLEKGTAVTLPVSPSRFDSLHAQFFIPDPARKKDPWQTYSDAVVADQDASIRGYYNIRFAADIKKMKEDINYIFQRDQATETVERTKIEKKK
ncbi:MAG TPA: hypothetical protein VI731_05650 [Bacteroidia bacterium]|nr:hypothetical protein [Bacteroidia bacterium]